MADGRICVLTDSAWVSARLRREAEAAVQRGTGELAGEWNVQSFGRLQAHSYCLARAEAGRGFAQACESIGSAAWTERTFLAVYVRRGEHEEGRFFVDGVLRARDMHGGDQAWQAFAAMCGRVGLNDAVVFGAGAGRVTA